MQALNVGDKLTDSFTVTTIDGTQQLVTIIIGGINDAAIISGTTTGSVVEAARKEPGIPIATGTLTSADVDNASDSFTPVERQESDEGYGTFTMTADGVWTYTLDDGNSAVQALNDGNKLIDSFTVTTIDGTERVVTIIINGRNDPAVISGDTAGSVVEAARKEPGIPIATGTLTSMDVDNASDSFTPVERQESDEGYGTFTMTADGEWTYTLDDGNSAVQALDDCGTLTDTFTVTAADGTEQVVTIVIAGKNDPAIISGDTAGSVVEAACQDPGDPAATGTLTSTDVDNASNTFTAVECQQSDGGYGTFTMTADGEWTYTLDNDNCEVQALGDCGTLTDTFTVTAADGTEQVVTIVIAGTNDPAIISGTTTGSVVEAACKDPGDPAATGTLTSTDVDNASNTFTAVECQQSDGGYGTFTMTADGEWTYTLDNDNCEVQALDDCDTLTDTFMVTTIDGTEQEVTISIQGADDKWTTFYAAHDLTV